MRYEKQIFNFIVSGISRKLNMPGTRDKTSHVEISCPKGVRWIRSEGMTQFELWAEEEIPDPCG